MSYFPKHTLKFSVKKVENKELGFQEDYFVVNCPACNCEMDNINNNIFTNKRNGSNFVSAKFTCVVGCKGRNGYALGFMIPQKKVRDYSNMTEIAIQNKWNEARRDWASGEIARKSEDIRLKADFDSACRQEEYLISNPDEIDYDELSRLSAKYDNHSSSTKKRKHEEEEEVLEQ